MRSLCWYSGRPNAEGSSKTKQVCHKIVQPCSTVAWMQRHLTMQCIARHTCVNTYNTLWRDLYNSVVNLAIVKTKDKMAVDVFWRLMSLVTSWLVFHLVTCTSSNMPEQPQPHLPFFCLFFWAVLFSVWQPAVCNRLKRLKTQLVRWLFWTDLGIVCVLCDEKSMVIDR